MKYLIGLYAVTVVIAMIYFNVWGQYAFKGFAYNFGRSVLWPAMAFPSFGALLGGLVLIMVLLALKARRN